MNWCRCTAGIRSALAGAILIVVAVSAAAQDTTGVGAISGVVVDAPDYARVDIRVDRTFTVGGPPLNVMTDHDRAHRRSEP